MKRTVNTLGKMSWGKRALGVLALFTATAIASPAQVLTTLVNFNGTNGGGSSAPLVQGTDGNLYGTTAIGGAGKNCTNFQGCGTIFKMTPGGTLTTLYNFCSQPNCTDGSDPGAALVQGRDGNFYGTTEEGANNTCGYGCGTIFKIAPGGSLTTLYRFCTQTNCTDGFRANGLVQGTDGNFYGTTQSGGATTGGTVFKITPSGTLTTLYDFCSQMNCTDGNIPSASLVQGNDGNFYGTTWAGGAVTGPCCGTVFQITPAGTLTTLVTVGGYPSGTLVQGTDGNFYGTTARGGTIFKITPAGTLTTLGFVGGFPYAGLVQATDGNFYGTTYVGGANDGNGYCQNLGCGSLFEITPAGAITILYNFCSQTSCADGVFPIAGLMQATNGNLYGTTIEGGANGIGTVFSLGVGLGPFVEIRPTSGEVGTIVTILGNNLKGTSRVSFNGTASVFIVGSSNGTTTITTKVPAGASSGTVQVVTPSGTLSSNVPFQVLP